MYSIFAHNNINNVKPIYLINHLIFCKEEEFKVIRIISADQGDFCKSGVF